MISLEPHGVGLFLNRYGMHRVVLVRKEETKQPTFHARHLSNIRLIMAKKTFEAALARLEQITEELADGELSLESSLKKFDEGIQTGQFLQRAIE